MTGLGHGWSPRYPLAKSTPADTSLPASFHRPRRGSLSPECSRAFRCDEFQYASGSRMRTCCRDPSDARMAAVPDERFLQSRPASCLLPYDGVAAVLAPDPLRCSVRLLRLLYQASCLARRRQRIPGLVGLPGALAIPPWRTPQMSGFKSCQEPRIPRLELMLVDRRGMIRIHIRWRDAPHAESCRRSQPVSLQQ